MPAGQTQAQPVVSSIGSRAPQLSHKQPILPLDGHVEFLVCQPIRLALTRNLYLAGAAAMLGAAVAWFAACVRSVLYGWWHRPWWDERLRTVARGGAAPRPVDLMRTSLQEDRQIKQPEARVRALQLPPKTPH